MPAYDRYCDLHISNESAYEFSSEILDYCKYQIENKKTSVVGKKSLIVLDYINSWEATGFELLKQFENAEVIFHAKFQLAVRKFSPMWKAHKAHLGNKKVLVDKKLENTLSTISNDLVYSAQNGFDGYVLQDSPLGASLTNWKDVVPPQGHDPIVVFSTQRDVSLLKNRGVGYLAMSIPMQSVALFQKEANIKEMLDWVVAGASKIRITCHGDGEGNLEMGGKYISADCFAKWFHENGLANKGQLATIGLNLCMAARNKLTPAVIKNGQYTPAAGSAVAALAEALGNLGLKGITVTGSNENVGATEVATMAREFPNGAPIVSSQAFRIIRIPNNFGFDKATYTLTVPTGWSVVRKPVAGSDLCVIKAPPQYTVSVKRSQYDSAQADGTSKNITQEYGEYKFTDPQTNQVFIFLEGWIVSESAKEATGAAGWQFVNAQHMKFAGTGGSFVLQTAGSTIQILERLAHSQAKAVAIS